MLNFTFIKIHFPIEKLLVTSLAISVPTTLTVMDDTNMYVYSRPTYIANKSSYSCCMH